jgi:uncharacterized membrane protein
MRELLWKYLIGPVVADAQNVEELAWQGATAVPGYNPVNTVFYALTALAMLYGVYRILQRNEIQFDSRTALYSVPFMFLGGALRFLEDAAAVTFPYDIALVTPLIYFLIAALYIPAVCYLENRDLAIYGSTLLMPVLLLSALQLENFKILYFFGVLISTSILTLAYYFVLEDRFTDPPMTLMALSQFFGGSASMLSAYQVENFAPKQLLAQTFYSVIGPPGILLMKIGVVALTVYVIRDLQDEKMKGLALLTLYAVGLGTGFRVFLRVLAGV